MNSRRPVNLLGDFLSRITVLYARRKEVPEGNLDAIYWEFALFRAPLIDDTQNDSAKQTTYEYGETYTLRVSDELQNVSRKPFSRARRPNSHVQQANGTRAECWRDTV